MASNLSIALVIGASVGGAVAAMRRVTNSLNVLRNDTLTTGQKFGQLGKNFALSVGSFAATTNAIKASMMSMAEPAIKFESAMADVKKVVDFKSPEGFKHLSKDILDLTRTLPMTAEELAQITASGGQLGVAEKDLKDFTTTIAKMSVAFDMSAEESGDAMAKLANVYKIPIKDIGNLGDAINELSNSSPAKASDIVNTLGRIGGVSKQFGLTENAAAALANSFISLGKAPEVAGTAINGMLSKLMTADKGGKAFQAALAQVGISAKELKGNIAKDGQAALTDFLKRLEKLPKDKAMGVLVDLFGREYADDVAVLASNVDVLDNSLKTLQDTDANGKPKYLGSMQKEFAARAATTENNLKLLKNSFTEVGITLGSAILPHLNNLVQALMPVVHWVADWISKNQEIVQIGLKVAGVVGAIVLGFSALNAITSAGSMIYLSVATGLGRLVSIFGFLSKGVSFCMPLISKLSLVFGYLIGYTLKFGMVLGGSLVKGLLVAGKAVLWLGRALMMNPIGLIITGIAVGAYLIYRYWEPISGFFTRLWSSVCSLFTQAWSSITSLMTNVWTEIKTAFDGGIAGISALILNWSPLGLFYKAFAGVLSWFGVELPSTFTGFGSNLIDGLVNGIQNAWNTAKEKVKELGEGIKNWFAEKLGIHSPSRVFKGFGENIVQGVVIGIDATKKLASGMVSKMGDKMIAAMPEKIQAPKLADGGLVAGIAQLMGKSQKDLDNAAVQMQKRRDQLVHKTVLPASSSVKSAVKERSKSGKILPARPVVERAIVAPSPSLLQANTAQSNEPKQGFFASLWSNIKGIGTRIGQWFSGLELGKTLDWGTQLLWGKSFNLTNLLVSKKQADWQTPSFNPQAENEPSSPYRSLQQTFKQRQQAQSNANDGLVVNFNPTIQINGNQASDGILNDLQQGLKMSLTEFERLFNRMMEQRGRRAY